MRGMVWLFGFEMRRKLGRRIRDGKNCRSTNVKRCQSADANITTRSKVRSCAPISSAMNLGSHQYVSSSSRLRGLCDWTESSYIHHLS